MYYLNNIIRSNKEMTYFGRQKLIIYVIYNKNI